MTSFEKERFCAFAAALFAPPDGALLADLRRDELPSLLGDCVRQWGGEGPLPKGLIPEPDEDRALTALQREYDRLFGPWGEKVSLVESTYKPWTGDKECQMVFAASRGLIMGDHALHMQELYRQSSLDIPDEYRSTPDHLVLELEFLALLYRFASDDQIERFIGDHLDWIPELKGALEKVEPLPFYGNAVELLHRFLQHETTSRKVKDRGTKKIH